MRKRGETRPVRKVKGESVRCVAGLRPHGLQNDALGSHGTIGRTPRARAPRGLCTYVHSSACSPKPEKAGRPMLEQTLPPLRSICVCAREVITYLYMWGPRGVRHTCAPFGSGCPLFFLRNVWEQLSSEVPTLAYLSPSLLPVPQPTMCPSSSSPDEPTLRIMTCITASI